MKSAASSLEVTGLRGLHALPGRCDDKIPKMSSFINKRDLSGDTALKVEAPATSYGSFLGVRVLRQHKAPHGKRQGAYLDILWPYVPIEVSL